jgi:hypothetical protein
MTTDNSIPDATELIQEAREWHDAVRDAKAIEANPETGRRLVAARSALEAANGRWIDAMELNQQTILDLAVASANLAIARAARLAAIELACEAREAHDEATL